MSTCAVLCVVAQRPESRNPCSRCWAENCDAAASHERSHLRSPERYGVCRASCVAGACCCTAHHPGRSGEAPYVAWRGVVPARWRVSSPALLPHSAPSEWRALRAPLRAPPGKYSPCLQEVKLVISCLLSDANYLPFGVTGVDGGPSCCRTALGWSETRDADDCQSSDMATHACTTRSGCLRAAVSGVLYICHLVSHLFFIRKPQISVN